MIAFTSSVQAEQVRHGSRAAYARLTGTGPGDAAEEALGADEIAFIAARDSFYLGTLSETGWPHVQQRGGPRGFVRVLDGRTIGWADFSGNRQYVSIGNASVNDRVALFLMDYAARTRLKPLGRMTAVEIGAHAELRTRLEVPGYAGRIEHAVLVDVHAFDWNCPQHIVPRFTAAQLAPGLAARIPGEDA